MSKTITIELEGTLFVEDTEEGFTFACVGDDRDSAEDLNMVLQPYHGGIVTVTINVG